MIAETLLLTKLKFTGTFSKVVLEFTTEYNGTLKQGDILDVTIQEKPKRRKVDGEWVEVGTELVIIAFCRKRG